MAKLPPGPLSCGGRRRRIDGIDKSARLHASTEHIAFLSTRFCGIADEPDETIVRLSEANAIDAVMLGAVARCGIAGVVMGNTAERLLQRLRGLVIALKPRGFQAPIAKD